MQSRPHGLDAHPHRVQLSDPGGAQLGRAQHRGHQLASMQRRAGIVAAHRGLQLAQYQIGLCGIRADHTQRPAALAVHRQALGKRIGDEKAQPRIGQGAHGVSVWIDAIAKALVSQVEEGDQARLTQHGNQGVPLRRRQIHPRRVVAAGVQQHHAARRQGAQRGQHVVEAQATRCGVVIRVGVDGEASAFEHGTVVVPGRVTHPKLAVREPAPDEIRPHFQTTGRAHRLDRRHALLRQRRVRLTEQQLGHFAAIREQAFHRQVGFRARLGGDALFGFGHSAHHGDAPSIVEIDANRQVDLARTRILLEVFVEGQDGVATIGLDVGKHG